MVRDSPIVEQIAILIILNGTNLSPVLGEWRAKDAEISIAINYDFPDQKLRRLEAIEKFSANRSVVDELSSFTAAGSPARPLWRLGNFLIFRHSIGGIALRVCLFGTSTKNNKGRNDALRGTSWTRNLSKVVKTNAANKTKWERRVRFHSEAGNGA